MVAQVFGSDIKVALYDENVTYGVSPLTPFKGRVAYVSKLGLNAARGLVDNPIITAGRAMRRPGVGNFDVTGGIETTVAPETIGFWLKHLLGAPTSSGLTPYTHVFQPRALPLGFVVEKDYRPAIASKVERFNGCRIASADFVFGQEGFSTLTMNIMGKSHQMFTAALDATLDDPGHEGFSGFEGVITDTPGGVNAGPYVPLAGVTGMKLRVDNSMPGGPYVFGGAGQRSTNPEGRCKVSGTLDLVFANFDLLDRARASEDVALAVAFVRGDRGGTPGDESLEFRIPQCQLKFSSPPLDTEAGLLISLEFHAYELVSGNDGGLVVTLTNSITRSAL